MSEGEGEGRREKGGGRREKEGGMHTIVFGAAAGDLI